MKFLRAVVALALVVALQLAAGRLWSEAHRYVEFLLLPVFWYGITASQRSAMLVGCAAGLLQDAWFEVGVFGLGGFKKTFLGWALGGLGARFDLNHQAGWITAGVLLTLADSLMDLGLRRMLDLEQAAPGVAEIVIRALVGGLLAGVAHHIQARGQARGGLRRGR